MTNFPGSLVSRATFCCLLTKAWTESVTSSNIMSGFRSCGIYPFNPDATLAVTYLPSNFYSTPACSQQPNTETTTAAAPLLTSSPIHTMDDTAPAAVPSQQSISQDAMHTADISTHLAVPDSFHLSDYICDNSQVITVSVTAPEIALNLCESSLSPEQLECYKFRLSRQYDLANDEAFTTWKFLKLQCESAKSAPDQALVSLPVSVTDLTRPVASQDEPSLVTDVDLGNISSITVSAAELLPCTNDR